MLDILLEDPQIDKCVVDLELGRYDQPGFEQVQLPLRAYLEWLAGGNESGKMNGKQVYLAQWRGLEEVGAAHNASIQYGDFDHLQCADVKYPTFPGSSSVPAELVSCIQHYCRIGRAY